MVTVRAARIVLLRVADALEAGLLDDLVAGLEDVSRAVALVERVSDQVDQAMPVLDSATPTLALMNSTLAQLEVTLAQLQSMPGVRMAKRLVGRPTSARRPARARGRRAPNGSSERPRGRAPTGPTSASHHIAHRTCDQNAEVRATGPDLSRPARDVRTDPGAGGV